MSNGEMEALANGEFEEIIYRLRDLGHDPKMSVEAFEIALNDLWDWKQKHFDPLCGAKAFGKN